MGIVVITGLNVRSGPGVTYSRIGGVKQGDQLVILEQSNQCTWLFVRTPGGLEGWVSGSAKYVMLNAACDSISAAGTPTKANFKEVARHNAYGITFIIELDTASNEKRYFLRAEGDQVTDTQRHGVGEIYEIAHLVSARTIAQNLTPEITTAMLDDGALFAAIDTTLNPETEGISLGYLTKGDVTWCGLSLKFSGERDRVGLIQTLRWNQAPEPWQLNFAPDNPYIKKLPFVEERGWFEIMYTATIIRSGDQPAKLKEQLILHASSDYTVNFLPSAVAKLGTENENEILTGETHQYLARGYVCPTKGENVLTPSTHLKVSYIEKLK